MPMHASSYQGTSTIVLAACIIKWEKYYSCMNISYPDYIEVGYYRCNYRYQVCILRVSVACVNIPSTSFHTYVRTVEKTQRIYKYRYTYMKMYSFRRDKNSTYNSVVPCHLPCITVCMRMHSLIVRVLQSVQSTCTAYCTVPTGIGHKSQLTACCYPRVKTGCP